MLSLILISKDGKSDDKSNGKSDGSGNASQIMSRSPLCFIFERTVTVKYCLSGNGWCDDRISFLVKTLYNG